MFIIVQNTVKQIVISIFEQISQGYVWSGSTQSWVSAMSDDGFNFKPLAVVSVFFFFFLYLVYDFYIDIM